MNMRQLAIGTIIGGVTLFLTGYVIFDLLAGEFYAANINAAPGLMRETQELWAIALGNLVFAILITIGILSATGPTNMVGGLKIGAIYSGLAWLSANLVLYGFLDLATPTLVVVDSLLELVHGAIGGALIALALSKLPTPSTA